MSTLCSAITRPSIDPKRTPSLRRLATITSLCVCAAVTTARAQDGAAETPPPPPDLRFASGGWTGDGLTNTDRGRFIACGAAARFAPDVTIEVALDRRFDVTLQFSSPRWLFGVGSTYDIGLMGEGGPTARAVRANKLSVAFGNDPGAYEEIFTQPWISATLPGGFAQFYVGDGPALLAALRRCAERGLGWETAAHQATQEENAVSTAAIHWCAPAPIETAFGEFVGVRAPANARLAPLERAGLAAAFAQAGAPSMALQPENLRRRAFPNARQSWTVGPAFGAFQLGTSGARSPESITPDDFTADVFGCGEGFEADVTMREALPLGGVARVILSCSAPQPVARFITLIRHAEKTATVEHCAEPEHLADAFQLDEAIGVAAYEALTGWRP